MRHRLTAILLIVLTAGWAVSVPPTVADDQTLSDDTVTVRTENGHHLLLPNDWPVEQKDGLLNPVPIEQYMSMKFGEVANRLDELNQRLTAFDQRLRRLEEQQGVLQAQLRTLEEQRQPEGR